MMKRLAELTAVVAVVLLAVGICPAIAYYRDAKTVKIGIITEKIDPLLPNVVEKAFQILTTGRLIGAKPGIDIKVVQVSPHDSFTASNKVCELIEKDKVSAIIGPESLTVSFHLDSLSASRFIPYVKILQDYYDTPRSSVNIVPRPTVFGSAVSEYILDRVWFREFTVVYESVEALFRLQDVLKLSNIKFHSIQLDSRGDYRPQLKYIKDYGFNKIVLDCSIEKVLEFFRQANEVMMFNEFYVYLVPNLDLYAVNLQELITKAVNITTFQMVNPDLPEFVVFKNALHEIYPENLRRLLPSGIKTEHAFVYDAILVVIKTIDLLHRTYRYESIYRPSLSCDTGGPIKMESRTFIDTLRNISDVGLTGLINFDEDGRRKHFNITIVKVEKEKRYTTLSEWKEGDRLHNILSEKELQQHSEDSLINQTVRITTIFSTPFLMKKENWEEFQGNDRFEGFVVDMAYEMGKKEQFIPIIEPVKDGKYGDNNTGGMWNGMVADLITENAQAAIGDLTITRLRQDAVDFTTPFMNLGIAILFKKPSKKIPSLFSFLDPFVSAVWICMGTAYLGVSIILFILARLAPSEWDNPHPCDSEPEELENQFNLLNCLWFSMGSLLQQGCDFLPKAISNRIIAAVWWFFTLIMISSYTANLAAFLTSSMMAAEIKNVEDLSRSVKIKYGCVQGGSTQNFFKTSSSPTYQLMWKTMQDAEPSVFCDSNKEGIERVLKGNYAFFMESMAIKYETERKCELTQVGDRLDNKGYGVATKKGSPWRNKMNSAVLRLQEDGTLLTLQRKWWERPPEKGKCDDDAQKSPMEQQKLGIENVGGVFVLLMAGMGLAIVVGIGELLWNTKKISIDENNTFKDQLIKELKFVINCKNSTKPVVKAPSEPLITGLRMELYDTFQDRAMHM